MNNPSRHSNISELKNRVPMFLAIFAALAMLVLNLAVKEPELQPDSVHPMANAKISLQQTFYCGSWGDAE